MDEFNKMQILASPCPNPSHSHHPEKVLWLATNWEGLNLTHSCPNAT